MLFDLAFVLISTFCLTFAWARYYIYNNLICLFLSISTTILCFLGIKTLFFSKKEQKLLKKQQKKQIDALADHLCFLPYKQVTELFLQLPQIKQSQPKVSKNVITIKENDVTKKLIFVFENAPLTRQNFCNIIKNNPADVIEIFATDFEKTLSQLAQKAPCKTKFFDKTAVYLMLKQANLLPPLTQKPNLLKSNFWYVVFDKSRAKYYLWSSLFLVLTSFLTFLPLYYLISGTILFFIAVYAKFNKKFNLKKEQKI